LGPTPTPKPQNPKTPKPLLQGDLYFICDNIK